MDRIDSMGRADTPPAAVRGGDDALFELGHGIGCRLLKIVPGTGEMTQEAKAAEFLRMWSVFQAGVAAAMAPSMVGNRKGEEALAMACGGSGLSAIEAAVELGPALFEYRVREAMGSRA